MTIPLAVDPFISGVFAGTGQSASIHIRGKATVMLWGGTATVNIERSVDGGATWVIASKDSSGTPAIYNATAVAPVSIVIDEPEERALYRLNCTAFTGATNYRISK